MKRTKWETSTQILQDRVTHAMNGNTNVQGLADILIDLTTLVIRLNLEIENLYVELDKKEDKK